MRKKKYQPNAGVYLTPLHFFDFVTYHVDISIMGGVCLSATGYIQVHAYTSNAQIPLKDVAIVVTDADGAAIAMRLTNRSGILDQPIPIVVPDVSASQSPNTDIIPFAIVNMYARVENFEEVYIENLQVFASTITNQNLEMIPLAEFPAKWNQTETFYTPAQNL